LDEPRDLGDEADSKEQSLTSVEAEVEIEAASSAQTGEIDEPGDLRGNEDVDDCT